MPAKLYKIEEGNFNSARLCYNSNNIKIQQKSSWLIYIYIKYAYTSHKGESCRLYTLCTHAYIALAAETSLPVYITQRRVKMSSDNNLKALLLHIYSILYSMARIKLQNFKCTYFYNNNNNNKYKAIYIQTHVYI